MHRKYHNIIPLIEYIKIDRFYIICYFKCDITKRSVISSVPFEPYAGAINITYKEMLLHPIDSYNKYYHTPINIYDNKCEDTIVLKAFKKISNKFRWSPEYQKYIHI